MTRFTLILCAMLMCAPAFAETIHNVTVCAIACNSEVEVQTDIDGAQSGTIYYAEFKNDTSTNPSKCMAQAKHLPTYEYKAIDQEELAQKGCSEILHDKFFGKKVDIQVALGKNNRPYVTEVIER